MYFSLFTVVGNVVIPMFSLAYAPRMNKVETFLFIHTTTDLLTKRCGFKNVKFKFLKILVDKL